MDDFDHITKNHAPTPARPLLGLTILVVEDSRFACEAMRLLCLKSGARIRRADCLASARRHLQVYRPTVVIIDLGLPDGTGLELIEELSRTTPRIGVILGISGDDGAESSVLTAGADGFLAKPVAGLARFQETILSALPADRQPPGPRLVNDDRISPDPAAFRDDMAHAADLLGDDHDGAVLDYVAQFLTGIAKSAADTPLEEAARALSAHRADKTASRSSVARLAGLVQDRLADQAAL